MKKKVLSGIAMAVIGASLAGCLAGCGGADPNSYSKYDKDGRMILSVWGTDQYAKDEVRVQFQNFLDKFNDTDEMKELGVKLQFAPMTTLPSTLKTSCLSGPTKMPDIVVWDRFSTPSATSYLLPIDDLIEKDGIDTTKFLKEAYDELTVDGVSYGLPMDADPWGIYVNMDQVATYNETAAEGDKIDFDNMDEWTWTKLMDVAEKLVIKEGNTVKRSGLNTTSADGQFFSFVYTGTGELIDTNKSSPSYGSTVMVEKKDALTDGQSLRVYDSLAFFKELYTKNLCDTGHGGTSAFGDGYCSMTYGSIYFPQELSPYKLKNYKMLPYPARDRTYANGQEKPQVLDVNAKDSTDMTNGQVGGMLGGYGLAIPQPTNPAMRTAEWQKHVEKAWEVIKLWIMNDEINELYFTENEAITCRADLWSNAFYTENTGVIGDIISYLPNYKMRPSVAGYEQFEANVVRSEIQLMKEGKSALDTYGNIRTKGNSTLKEAQGR